MAFKTMHERANFLFAFFTELRRNDERNYKVLPEGLRNRHVQFMVSRWVRRGLAPGTIQLYLSYLRVFAGWIGKDGMVLEPIAYGVDPARVRRTFSAETDRSWSAAGVEAAELVARVTEADVFVGAQLAMCLAFGLRVKEAIMFQPFRAVTDGGGALQLLRGTKGGRARQVPIDTEAKRAALELARRVAVSDAGHLGDPRRSLEQNRARFYTVLARFGITRRGRGVTAHGLRHQYANDRYQDFAGAPSPVRGGERLDRDADRHARLQVAEELGHARENISTAYLGAILQQRRTMPLPGAPSTSPSQELSHACE
ncbi:MAG TPA: integrase domain-containing protein [Burkholderiaceae bacterium]|nr:integrase domain-containing protein [Burkholderiaceae bacterium]